MGVLSLSSNWAASSRHDDAWPCAWICSLCCGVDMDDCKGEKGLQVRLGKCEKLCALSSERTGGA